MATTTQEQEYISLSEASDRYGVARATLRHKVARGFLTVFSHPWHGSIKLLSVDELEKLFHGKPQPLSQHGVRP